MIDLVFYWLGVFTAGVLLLVGATLATGIVFEWVVARWKIKAEMIRVYGKLLQERRDQAKEQSDAK